MQLPNIIYGTAWKKEATTPLVVEAIKSGFRAIDTACQPKHYSEKGVGQALEQLYAEGFQRRELFLQTKFTPLAGQDPKSIPYDKNSSLSKQLADSFELSKKNLKTDYINSYILHSPLFPSRDLFEVWQAMEEIHKRKEALHLGISNCYELSLLKKLYERSEIKPSFVQNRFYSDSDYDKELRLWCDKHNIIYQSFWTLSANPHILGSESIIKLALKYKKSQAQILFNYLNAVGITPLSGSTSTEHIKEGLSAFDFELQKEEILAVSRLF